MNYLMPHSPTRDIQITKAGLLSKLNFSEELVSNPINVGEQIILISKKGTLFILG